MPAVIQTFRIYLDGVPRDTTATPDTDPWRNVVREFSAGGTQINARSFGTGHYFPAGRQQVLFEARRAQSDPEGGAALADIPDCAFFLKMEDLSAIHSHPHLAHELTGWAVIVTLVPALTADDFEAASLRSRAAKAPRMGYTRLFKAMADGVEAGVVVLDIHPASDSVILYELYLCSAERNRGVGTRLLAAVEAYAESIGRSCVDLWPRSLDRRNRSDAQLGQWYGRHGYTPAYAGSERLRKTLSLP